ncbi:MAG: segregation/condensation protein A [Clostridia bacterium]|nr:segregation/condensation protein A [Clostridia bacterium]
MEELTYRLDQFEGPLDLLLTLIAKNKVSITDIPIAVICDQYMEYIEANRKMDLDIASEFVVMASELMLIKSRMLLPRDEENDPDPRAELIDALLIYQKAKEAAEELRPLYAEFSGRMAKDIDEIPPDRGVPLGLNPMLLSKAMNAMLLRMREKERQPEHLITPLVKTKVYSVEDEIEGLVSRLDTRGETSLFFLLKDATERSQLLAMFMGLLELIKIKRVLICDNGEEEAEALQDGLLMKFRLNPDYVPEEGTSSEFDQTESEGA